MNLPITSFADTVYFRIQIRHLEPRRGRVKARSIRPAGLALPGARTPANAPRLWKTRAMT
jgi:hypothetical protein